MGMVVTLATFSPMKLSQRIWVLLAGLVVLLVVWEVWSRRPRDLGTRKLADGSVLTLKAATYEKEHRVRAGERWLDYLGPILPEALAKKLQCRFLTIGGRTNALDLWLVRNDFPTATASGLRGAVFDEHGCEFKSVPAVVSVSLGSAREVLSFQFTEFPRRDRTLGFRLYEQANDGTWFTLAEFVMPNPGQRPHPVWPAASLPLTQTTGGVDFTLLELKGGLKAPNDYPSASGARARFRMTENGQPTAAWEFAGLNRIRDALGQSVAGSHTVSMPEPGDCRVRIDAGLCTEEAAWKLEVAFARAKDFPAEDLWTVPFVPVPERTQASGGETRTNLHGMEFSFRGIVGAFCPEPRLRRSLSGSPVAYMVCTNLSESWQLKLVRALDDQGRQVESGGSASAPPDYLFRLNLAPDARKVQCMFAVTRRVPVQFVAKPSRAIAADSRKLESP